MSKKRLFSFTVIFSFSILLSCQTLSSFFISEEDEIEIGVQTKAQIIADKKNYPLYKDRTGHDPRVINYIDSIGNLLAFAQDDRDTLHFSFTIIDNDTTINAFAIPGGHVFVYTGLLLTADNGSEVAGVLAHEIGHITKYHGRDLMVSAGIAGTVQQILFGDSASIASAVTSLLTNMLFLQFSKPKEYQADSCAVAYTTKAGINPRGMKSFLEKLGKNDPEGKIFEPFSSHPPTSERVNRVQEVIDKTPNVPNVGERMFESEYLKIRSLLKL